MEIDLSELPRATRLRLRQIWSDRFEQQLFQAIQNQEKVARHFREQEPIWREGIGERVMAIDPLFRWLIKHHFGDEDTRDPKFWDWFRKRYEQFKVKSRAPKPQVGWRYDGGPSAGSRTVWKSLGARGPAYGKPFGLERRVKFQKVYA